MKVLAGDVGGTSARLAIVEVDADAARILALDIWPVTDEERRITCNSR